MHYQMRRVLKSLTYVRNHKSHRFMIQIIIFLNRFPDASRFDIAEITSFECVTLDCYRYAQN